MISVALFVCLWPPCSIGYVDNFLLESFNGSFDPDEFVLQLAPQTLSSNCSGDYGHLFDCCVNLLFALFEVLEGVEALLLRHEAGAWRVLGLLLLDHFLNVLILALLVVPLDVARHLPVVLVQLHLL